MIKVAYFSNQFASLKGHGITRYSHHLYEAMLASEKRLKLYPMSASTNGSKSEIRNLKSRTGLFVLPLGRIFTPIAWNFFNMPRIESFLLHDINVVHSLSLGYKIATGKPHIVTIHDIGPLTHPQYFTRKDKYFMKRSFKQAVYRSSAMICVSQATANEVVEYAYERYHVDIKSRIHVVHEGVDNLFYKVPRKIDIEDFSLVDSIISNPFILCVGKISPRKNSLSVLKAFGQIKNDIPNLQLIMAGGNGWDYDMVIKQVKLLGLENRVHFLGYISDELLRFLYSRALVFVYPSLFEGFGLTVLEAMASGCPVITSNNSSLPEIAGDAAILINPKDVEALASNILGIYHNLDKRSLMISKGLEQAQLFSWEKAADLTFNVYKSVIKQTMKK